MLHIQVILHDIVIYSLMVNNWFCPLICLRTLLGIKWHQFVRNEEVRGMTKQPNLSAILQSWHLSILRHIAHIDDDADAKIMLTAPPPENWKRPPGRPRITWLNTVQWDLRAYNLTLNKAVDLAQNRPLWRLCLCMALRTPSDACQKRRRRRIHLFQLFLW